MRERFSRWFVLSGLSAFLFLFANAPVIAVEDSSDIKILKTVPEYAEEVKDFNNLVISIHFNREMDPEMEEDFLLDQRGASDADGNPIVISGKFSWPNPKTLQFKPTDQLKPNALYQISLFAVIAKNGDEMDEVPFRSVFKTVSK